jgi:4-hydroxyphenylpyruvate dioxygenase
MGMCLDTYQILAQVWGDCTTESGVRENADRKLQEDIDIFLKSVPLEKVYYVQLSDAARQSPPIGPSHPWYDATMKPNMIWSRNARLFPFEVDGGGYLPVMKLLETWIWNWGYRGWVSMEVFNRSLSNPDPSVPESQAQRGMVSWKKCVKALKLDENPL